MRTIPGTTGKEEGLGAGARNNAPGRDPVPGTATIDLDVVSLSAIIQYRITGRQSPSQCLRNAEV